MGWQWKRCFNCVKFIRLRTCHPRLPTVDTTPGCLVSPNLSEKYALTPSFQIIGKYRNFLTFNILSNLPGGKLQFLCLLNLKRSEKNKQQKDKNRTYGKPSTTREKNARGPTPSPATPYEVLLWTNRNVVGSMTYWNLLGIMAGRDEISTPAAKKHNRTGYLVRSCLLRVICAQRSQWPVRVNDCHQYLAKMYTSLDQN